MPIFTIITMVIKFAPIIIGLLSGLGNALNRLQPQGKIKIDEESLSKLVEELTQRQVEEIVERHKGRIVAYVPNEEDKQRQETLDELERRLRRDQEDYEERQRAKERAEQVAERRKEIEERLKQEKLQP